MQKKIEIGKIDYNKNGKKLNLVDVIVSLEENINGKPRFTAQARVWNKTTTYCYMVGQCFEELKEYTDISKNEIFSFIYDMWQKYHLNDMHAGTPRQEKAIKEKFGFGYKVYNFSEQCDYLKSINLLEDEGHVYGNGWLYHEIHSSDLEKIKNFLSIN